MSTEAGSLPEDVATLAALVREQLATIATQQRQLDQLKQYVERLLRDRYGPRSEKLDPNQLLLFENDNNDSPPPTAPLDEPSITIQEHKRRYQRSRKLPADLPRERVEHDLADAEKCCPGCGEIRQRIGSELSEQLEFVPASLKVIQSSSTVPSPASSRASPQVARLRRQTRRRVTVSRVPDRAWSPSQDNPTQRR